MTLYSKVYRLKTQFMTSDKEAFSEANFHTVHSSCPYKTWRSQVTMELIKLCVMLCNFSIVLE